MEKKEGGKLGEEKIFITEQKEKGKISFCEGEEETRRKRRKINEEGKIVAGGRSEATLAPFVRVPLWKIRHF